MGAGKGRSRRAQTAASGSPSEAAANGWTQGRDGKGNLDGFGAYHWNVDEHGAPHHIDYTYDGEVPSRRFDIEPDGTIYPVIDGIDQRWDDGDWEEALASNPEFKRGDEKPLGLGHAQNILDKLEA
jgi:hypothetical protein